MHRFACRPVCLIIVAGVVLMGAAPAAAAPGSRDTVGNDLAISASRYAPDSQECSMLRKINTYRKANGKATLRLSRTLGAAAEHHSRDMAAKDYFSHTLAGGTTWAQNIANHGYPTNTSRAENIAAGHSSATDTFTQWRNSSGHRANMINGTYKAIGIGRASNSNSTYGWYWTTTFGSTVDGTVAC